MCGQHPEPTHLYPQTSSWISGGCQWMKDEWKGSSTFTLCVELMKRIPLKRYSVILFIVVAGNQLLGASQCVSSGTVVGPLIYTPSRAVTSISDNCWLYWSHVRTAARLGNGPYVVDKFKDRIESLWCRSFNLLKADLVQCKHKLLLWPFFFLKRLSFCFASQMV